MRLMLFTLLLMPAALGFAAVGDEEPAERPRVDLGENAAVAPREAGADAPLPEGFPGATKPGQIEVKSYPSYRSAVAKGEGMTTRSGDFLFWALFRHISTKNVAMTAPVINTYKTPGMVQEGGRRGDLTMEFPYEDPKLGQAGPGVGAVEVVDHPAATYVAIGVQGRMSDEQFREANARLTAWLESHKAEWAADGPPRRLGYHGPMTPAAERLWELQIPIRKAEGAKPDREKATDGR
jgi:hypothetical protein